MAKFFKWYGQRYLFECPGCECIHAIDAEEWDFNQDLDNPTVYPSLFINPDSDARCHSWIKNGQIQFLNDCDHQLAGKTVEIPEWEE